jgi:hypothetical protein
MNKKRKKYSTIIHIFLNPFTIVSLETMLITSITKTKNYFNSTHFCFFDLFLLLFFNYSFHTLPRIRVETQSIKNQNKKILFICKLFFFSHLLKGNNIEGNRSTIYSNILFHLIKSHKVI